MTKEEVEKFIELREKFETSVEKISNYFKKFDKNFNYVDPSDWILDIKTNEFYYIIYGGDYDDEYVSFDTKWMYATDEELQDYTNKMIAKKKEEEAFKRQLKAKMDKEARRLQYEELKKEFENV